jgi:hypothetical protein
LRERERERERKRKKRKRKGKVMYEDVFPDIVVSVDCVVDVLELKDAECRERTGVGFGMIEREWERKGPLPCALLTFVGLNIEQTKLSKKLNEKKF